MRDKDMPELVKFRYMMVVQISLFVFDGMDTQLR